MILPVKDGERQCVPEVSLPLTKYLGRFERRNKCMIIPVWKIKGIWLLKGWNHLNNVVHRCSLRTDTVNLDLKPILVYELQKAFLLQKDTDTIYRLGMKIER